MKSRPFVAILVLALSGVFATPQVVLAVDPCHVNNGTINASDGAGWPGATDAPTPDRQWGPIDSYHDLKLAEWCEPSHDWLRDSRISWTNTAMAIVQDRWDNHQNFMVFEQIVKDEWQYNNALNVTSNLPYVTYYVADIFEQASQHYEEAGWWMHNRTAELVAGVNYHAYAQWDQEKSPLDPPNGDHGGFRLFSSQAEILKPDLFDWDGVDRVGLVTDKLNDQ